MRTSLFLYNSQKSAVKQLFWKKQYALHLLALLSLSAMVLLTFGSAHAFSFDHTKATVDTGCQSFTFSPDGNPFPLCPGPIPIGGNCVWWGWEQWHLLGYDLPSNWGNAAEWIVDAERFGLPIGTQPRVGSLAVFPVADGVWAFGAAGHVAFVTAVSPDGQNFDVTYQNYGDPTPMFTGHGYNVSFINQPRFQNGQLRFIYFPKPIDPARFATLPGANGNGIHEIFSTNAQLDNSSVSSGPLNGALASSRVGLGLPPGANDQEFSADFAGNGYTDLLLYNRQQGRLDVLALDYPPQKIPLKRLHNYPVVSDLSHVSQRVSLRDSQTSTTGWGQNLDIHLGDFTGSGHTEILLYDRVSGQIQLLTLTPQLTIARHVTLAGWGPGWELYIGQFDGQRTDLFFYKRFAVPTPLPTAGTTPTPGVPTSTPGTGIPATPPPASQPTTTPTPAPNRTPTPTPTPSPTPTPTPSPAPTPAPTPSPSPTPTPTPTATPTPSPTPAPTPTPSPSPTATSTTGSPTTPTPTPTVQPTSTATPTASGTQSSTAVSFTGSDGAFSSVALDAYKQVASGTGEPTDTSGKTPSNWNTSGLSAKILLVSLKKDFSVGIIRDYSLWHNSWEVYINHFAAPNRDGIFLYDRNTGEGRLVEYTSDLQLSRFQFLHNLGGNWDVHTGDFGGQGQAQILLYDPSSGDARILTLKKDLSVDKQLDYPGWATNQVVYVGHFGLPTLSIMLYDPQQAQSTFIALDSSLSITHQVTVQSWDQNSQILVGAFLDRARCLEQHTCATGDDLLVLNRTTGTVGQYVFSFSNQFSVYDNRIQAYLREGIATTVRVFPVDESFFSLLSSEDSSIHNEELY